MPLEKRFYGRRIKRTKRKSARVLVCLKGESPGQPNEWIAVSTRAYVKGLTHHFVPARDRTK